MDPAALVYEPGRIGEAAGSLLNLGEAVSATLRPERPIGVGHVAPPGGQCPVGASYEAWMTPPAAGSSALVVDDDALVCDLAARILAGAGYQVRIAYDGEEAWDAIQLDPPSVVLTDFLMPRLDGLELADRLLGTGARIPIVIMSGVYEGIAIPGVHFLRKPFRAAELTDTVRRALAEVANLA